jgi:hypothetical protein
MQGFFSGEAWLSRRWRGDVILPSFSSGALRSRADAYDSASQCGGGEEWLTVVLKLSCMSVFSPGVLDCRTGERCVGAEGVRGGCRI